MRNCVSAIVRPLLAALAILLSGWSTPDDFLSTDFAAAEMALNQQLSDVHALEAEHGFFAHQLVEPLHQLANQQLAVNRFEDAADSVARAIQIARIGGGLYTPEQYDLVQLEMDISRLRHDWTAFAEQLEHYLWLLDQEFSGTVGDRVRRLLWAADAHLAAAFDGPEEGLGGNLMEATRIHEFAVAYAHHHGLTETSLFTSALYELTHKYFLEIKAIAAGGPVGYKLRLLGPLGQRLDRRGDAIEKRFLAGQDKLIMLRNILSQSARYDAEAAAMGELYLADWRALFADSDAIESIYADSIRALRESGATDARVARFLANPAVLPRPRLELSLDSAVAMTGVGNTAEPSPLDDAPRRSADGLVKRVRVLEPTSNIPGYSADLTLLDWDNALSRDWETVSVTLTLDPRQKAKVRLGTYRLHSMLTGEDIDLQDEVTELPSGANEAISRIRALAFRPAFEQWQPVSSRLALDFVFAADATPKLTPEVSSRAIDSPLLLSSRAAIPTASLAAAGE